MPNRVEKWKRDFLDPLNGFMSKPDDLDWLIETLEKAQQSFHEWSMDATDQENESWELVLQDWNKLFKELTLLMEGVQGSAKKRLKKLDDGGRGLQGYRLTETESKYFDKKS